MLFFYRLIFWPLFIILLPGYLIKLWRRGGKWHIKERFGIISPPDKIRGIKRLWIHAVSVGELNALKPLLQRLKADPVVEVVLSVTTTTAYRLAEEKFKDLYVYLFTFPIDLFSGCVFKRLKPEILVLMEGELWPETLHQAKKHNTQAYLINARLSDRSFGRMKLWRAGARALMSHIHLIMAATPQDAERYRELSGEAERVLLTGNLKFDATISGAIDEAKRAELMASLGFVKTDKIMVGASTWPGEEEALLAAHKELKGKWSNLKLLMVPRHAERGGEVESILKNGAVTYHRRSAGAVSCPVEVVLADTTGELSSLVQLGSVVFIGKSLPPHTEGQTPIETAAAGKPILMGPGMSNFRQIARSLVESGGGRIIKTTKELTTAIGEVLADEGLRVSMGAASRAWYEANRGATEKTLKAMGLVD